MVLPPRSGTYVQNRVHNQRATVIDLSVASTPPESVQMGNRMLQTMVNSLSSGCKYVKWHATHWHRKWDFVTGGHLQFLWVSSAPMITVQSLKDLQDCTFPCLQSSPRMCCLFFHFVLFDLPFIHGKIHFFVRRIALKCPCHQRGAEQKPYNIRRIMKRIVICFVSESL